MRTEKPNRAVNVALLAVVAAVVLLPPLITGKW